MKVIDLNMEIFPQVAEKPSLNKNNFNSKDFSSFLKVSDQAQQNQQLKKTTEDNAPSTNPLIKADKDKEELKEEIDSTELEDEFVANGQPMQNYPYYFINFISQEEDFITDSMGQETEIDLTAVELGNMEGQSIDEAETMLTGDVLTQIVAETQNEVGNEEETPIIIEGKIKEGKTSDSIEKDSPKIPSKQVVDPLLLNNIQDDPSDEVELSIQDLEKLDSSYNSFKPESKSAEVKDVDTDTVDNKVKDETTVGDNITPTPYNKTSFNEGQINSLESEDPIDPKDLIQQIVQKFEVDLSQEKNEMKISLKPEALGNMTMSIEVVKETIIARIMVDNHRTKEIIENNLFQLKEGIKDSGLEIKTFEVFVGNNSDFDQHNPSSNFNFNQGSRKIKIKSMKNDSLNYEGSINESNAKTPGVYSTSNINLLA